MSSMKHRRELPEFLKVFSGLRALLRAADVPRQAVRRSQKQYQLRTYPQE
jgi:hypothetical protein